MRLPDTILSHVLSYIPIPERFSLSSICKQWYALCHDPYLYQYIELCNLEYQQLVLTLQKVASIAPRIKSIVFIGCYSTFIQNTVVPVRFSDDATAAHHTDQRPLFSHITALQPARRREEYLKHKFELHDQFSDVMIQLMRINKTHLKTLTIVNCTLDLEMTELFCSITCYGNALESFIYKNNHDSGIPSSGLLQAIVTACRGMRHFHGLHSGMDDAVLLTIARHWATTLESLTLCSMKSREVVRPTEVVSDRGRHLMGTSPTGRISSQAFWQLLSRCEKLEYLELQDLACISNYDLARFESLRMEAIRQIESSKIVCNKYSTNSTISKKITTTTGTTFQQRRAIERYSPYLMNKSNNRRTRSNHSLPSSSSPSMVKRSTVSRPFIPGSSIKQLYVTKFMTTPLSKPGFEILLKMFPSLNHLEYETNFLTFDNLFEGITRDMFDAECAAVKEWFDKMKSRGHYHQLTYIGNWNAHITAEQRLMAGMASVSEDSSSST